MCLSVPDAKRIANHAYDQQWKQNPWYRPTIWEKALDDSERVQHIGAPTLHILEHPEMGGKIETEDDWQHQYELQVRDGDLELVFQ